MNRSCGLILVKGEEESSIPVPLTGVSVSVRIFDLVAEVNIEQRYVNREILPIEAVYKFPLDEGAAVCRFTAEVDGRVIEGVVKETEEARAEYQEAITTGHSAFLVEEKLPDVFKAKVGNLAPGSGAKIRLTYVTELKVEGGEVRFYLPTTIAPRYIPASDTSSAAVDLGSINYTSKSDYKVEFQASVKMGSAIQGIRSPTHKISVTNEGLKGTVTLGEVVTSMDKDLVLYVKVAEPNQPRLLCEKSKSSNAMMLSMVPSFKLAEQKTEMIFVIDRSGSMQGAGIEQARQALKLFIHSLPVDCYVNVVGFGFSFQFLFPEGSRKYSDDVLQACKAHAETLNADLGGTEIYAPLQAIFELKPVEGYLRQIFLLTDGEVSNVDQVTSLVRTNNSRARVFALGLGSSASHHLVEGIARAGNGTALFASLEERLEKKVMQQLQDALQPALTDIRVNWNGYEEETNSSERKLRQAPCDKMIPPVFDGRHLVVYALLKEGAHVPQWVNLVANAPVGPLTIRVPLTCSELEESTVIHTLAAKKLIQLLQDQPEDPERKKEIIQLGCAYGLASRYTSYVAVDPKEQKSLKESWMMMKSRDVPVQVAHGWGGGVQAQARMCFRPPMMNLVSASAPSPPPPMMSRSRAAPMKKSAAMPMQQVPGMAPMDMCARPVMAGTMEMARGLQPEMAPISNLSSLSAPPPAPPSMESSLKEAATLTDDDKVMKIVSIQSFDGAFKMDPILAELLNTTVDDIAEAGRKGQHNESVWATLIALAFLTVVLPHLQNSWMLVASKAEKWLGSQQLADRETAKGDAELYVKSKLNL